MIEFFVPGLCKPAGSKKAFVNKYTGRASVVDACDKSRDWKADVKLFASQAYSGPLLTGPLRVEFSFFVARPKCHYGSGKNSDTLKPSAPHYPIGKPDVLKLARACEDALSGVIYGDDAQIVTEVIAKRYARADDNQPGTIVTIRQADMARDLAQGEAGI